MKYALMPTMASFDENGFAINDGWVIVYNTHPVTKELINCTYARATKGVSVAANAYLDAPEDMGDEYAIVRDGDRWSYVKDYRDTEVYHKETGQPYTVVELGELPEELTTLKPASEFDKWNGQKWVTDENALLESELKKIKSRYLNYLNVANDQIKWLEDALSIEGMEQEGDREKLLVWKKYRIELSRLDLTSVATIVPELPY